MDILFEFQDNLLRPVKNDFRRYLVRHEACVNINKYLKR